MSELMREEFEAWAIREAAVMQYSFPQDVVYINGNGDYAIVWVQGAWLGWQASRAALCVELPKEVAAGRWADDTGYFKDDIIEAIQAVGVKTK